ncbi:glycosyltransferase [Acinetobacter towneri]|uniref:glycosyltransferase n=1 Tax=Acinetobacter towneri TaxID=202956 RepID=UPI002575C787|nr:glycosyltransferase [Acinetobacter towneri]MDM1754641.1 glycosyltransferase [Acinetobacter towneri]
MKILYVVTGLGLGGAEKVVCDLADQMEKNGHTVKIAYLTGVKLVTPISSNIEIIYLGLNNINSFISASIKYRKLLKNFHPDVVHAHMVHANLFTRLNRIFVNVPRLICSAHSTNEGGKLRMLAYRFTHNLSEVTTNVSNEASRNFIANKAVINSEILTVYNGIDLKKFIANNIDLSILKKKLNISAEAKVLIAVGRFHEAKDYPNLINAFNIFLEKFDKNLFHLFIVGDGDLAIITEIKNLIQTYNLGNNIHLLGRRDDIAELLSGADLFVLSSKYEGLPTVVIEAMACEKFVVATDCGGSAEILGETGILVPIEDSEALAKGLEQAISLTGDQIRNNGKLARERVEKLFSLEASINKWLALYEAK